VRRAGPRPDIRLWGVWGLCLLAAAGCASSGHGGPSHYTNPIHDITQHGGHLGWGGIDVGMSFLQAQTAVGHHLPPLKLDPHEGLCGYASVDVLPHGQPLRLEFEDAAGGGGRLKAIWLLLPDRQGKASVAGMARVLRERFPDLTYVTDHRAGDLPLSEATNLHPVYRGAGGSLFYIDPQLGVYFGEICLR
jgi:hypothetical protein